MDVAIQIIPIAPPKNKGKIDVDTGVEVIKEGLKQRIFEKLKYSLFYV